MDRNVGVELLLIISVALIVSVGVTCLYWTNILNDAIKTGICIYNGKAYTFEEFKK